MRLLTIKQVEEMTTYSRWTLANKERAGTFPKRIALGEGPNCRKAYREDEILAWIEAQPRGFIGGELPRTGRPKKRKTTA